MNAEMDISKNQWRSTGGKSLLQTGSFASFWLSNSFQHGIIESQRPELQNFSALCTNVLPVKLTYRQTVVQK